MNTIDIDVGGTFTDTVLNFDGKVLLKKVPTTPHDLSECFMKVIEEGAKEIDLTLQELLPKIDIIRYSTTIAMNRLIERKGPALGLITTEGHEDAILIGKGAQWTDGKRVTERRNIAIQKKPIPLIPRDMIVGVKERIDSFGNVIRPLDEDDVRRKVYYLIDKGARCFVVSLLWSPVNSIHEKRIQEIIREEYKEYYLGYLPIVLSHAVIGRSGEYQRTMTAILDAYLHRAMQTELSAMWDRLREYGYTGPFMMVHNSGGMAEVFKTDAIRTYNAGPVSGLIGSYYLAQELGYRNVIGTDVGGTSFDLGLVAEQNVRNYEFRPIIDTWMVGITMLQTYSIGAGGGSIAWINESAGNRLEVGPQSAGSYPGPACYNLGGTEPTVTDADLILGYINPDYYYAGKMKLNKELAMDIIKEKIADPLGADVTEAAYLIKKILDSNMGSAIRKEVHLRGYDPKEFILFAFGGGGPTHVGGYLQDIPVAITFPFSPVFSAVGSSVMDIIHIFEFSRRFMLMEPMTREFAEDYTEFNSALEMLMDKAKKEIEGEGFSVDNAVFNVELDMLYGGQVQRKRSLSPVLFIKTKEDAKAVYQDFEKEFSETFSPLVVHPEGGVYIENIVLRATIPTEKPKLPKHKLQKEDSLDALKGKRAAYWGNGGLTETNIFDLALLRPGNMVNGPAIIEAEYTTITISPEFQFKVDEYNFGRLTRKE
jgi:N-methylhydantoinase A/acetophenone carboxylase